MRGKTPCRPSKAELLAVETATDNRSIQDLEALSAELTRRFVTPFQPRPPLQPPPRPPSRRDNYRRNRNDFRDSRSQRPRQYRRRSPRPPPYVRTPPPSVRLPRVSPRPPLSSTHSDDARHDGYLSSTYDDYFDDNLNGEC